MASVLAAPNWPAFHGPNSSGVGLDDKPPVTVGPTNSVLWKTKVPWAPSSPCVWDDQIYVTTFDAGELDTQAYRRADGTLAWSHGVRADKLQLYHGTESSPAASSPVVDGSRVVSYFGSFGLVCYDHAGRELWRHPMPVATSLGGYGTATSPVIASGLVVVMHDRDEHSTLLAADLATGKTVWETARPNAFGSFGTPVVWQNAGSLEIVVPGSIRLKGYDLKTGKEDWVVDGLCPFPYATPIVTDDFLLYGAWTDGKADSPWPSWEQFLEKYDKNKNGTVELTEFDDASRDYFRGFDTDQNGRIDQSDLERMRAALVKGENLMVAVKPGGHGDITRSHVAWQTGRGVPYIASPVVWEGRIYTVRSGGMMSCFDAKTGKTVYLQERLGVEGNYYASLIAADGRVYAASQSGKLLVVKAGGDHPEILHQADFGEPIYATPALAGGQLYLRTHDHLYAFGNR